MAVLSNVARTKNYWRRIVVTPSSIRRSLNNPKKEKDLDNTQVTPETCWDERYGASDAIWSGNVNVALADVGVERELEVGTALDLGCGEGADALWLAQHGWRTT